MTTSEAEMILREHGFSDAAIAVVRLLQHDCHWWACRAQGVPSPEGDGGLSTIPSDLLDALDTFDQENTP